MVKIEASKGDEAAGTEKGSIFVLPKSETSEKAKTSRVSSKIASKKSQAEIERVKSAKKE